MAWFHEKKYRIIRDGDAEEPSYARPRSLGSERATFLFGTWPIRVLLGIVLIQALALVGLLIQSRSSSLLDRNGPILERVRFQDEAQFRHLKTEEEVSKAWEEYKLPDSGFVHLEADQLAQYGLEPNNNVVTGFENVYLISAFHGLHCLQKLHLAFARLQANSSNTDTEDHDSEVNHASHCFSYLRQSILCGGDMALEGPDHHPQRGESPLRGWGVEHQCRSWADVLQWRDNHAIPDVHKMM